MDWQGHRFQGRAALAEPPANVDRVVIIGGGLSGLVAAHRIAVRGGSGRRPVEIVVLEAKDRVGGAIWTDRRDGFTLEGGADSFITNKPHAVDLCHALGLGDRLIGTDDQHRRSFVGPARAARAGARGVRADGPAAARADADHPPALLAREAAADDGPGPAPPGRGRRREPLLVRPPPPGSRGLRAPGAAAGGRDLHGRPERAEPAGDPAAVPGDGAGPRQPDPRRASRGPRRRGQGRRPRRRGRPLRPVRHPGRGHGHTPQGPGRRLARRRPATGFGRPPALARRAGRPLAGRAARRPADRGCRRHHGHGGPRLRPATGRHRPGPGAVAALGPVRLLGDRPARLPSRPGRPPAGRLRRGGAGDRGARPAGRLLHQRQVPPPRPGRHRPCCGPSSAERPAPTSSSATTTSWRGSPAASWPS